LISHEFESIASPKTGDRPMICRSKPAVIVYVIRTLLFESKMLASTV
jgi:hypothetical protein